MTQVKLWTILGETQTGKSRTVRELASLKEKGRSSTVNSVLLRGGGKLRVCVKRMAWQENRKTPSESVVEIKAMVASQKAKLGRDPTAVNVLTTLRFDAVLHKSPTKSCSAGETYLEAWVKEGWRLESLVLMSPERGGPRDHYADFGAPTLWVPRSRELPLSEMVGRVRNHFGWA